MTTRDAFLGGRLVLEQPARGFRAGLDSVMLAASVPATGAESVLELGSGAGVAALCLAARLPEVVVTGLEMQGDMVALANTNAAANGLAGRARFLHGRVEATLRLFRPDSFDHVMMNPPFFVDGPHDPSPDEARRLAAQADGDALVRWARAARTLLHAKGRLTAILPAERLADLLEALKPGFGGIEIVPLWPRKGQEAKRIVVLARKGSRAPLHLRAGLVLHEGDGANTPAAECVLRHATGLAEALEGDLSS